MRTKKAPDTPNIQGHVVTTIKESHPKDVGSSPHLSPECGRATTESKGQGASKEIGWMGPGRGLPSQRHQGKGYSRGKHIV